MAALKSRFKLCTFDVTNTLLKFQMSVGEQYSKIGRLYGVEREADVISKAFRHHWKDMSLNHPNFGRESGFSSREWWKEMVRRTFSVGSSTVSRNQLNSLFDHLYELYSTGDCWKVAAGTEDVLKCLNENNVTIGVISNFDERLDSVLRSTGLHSYFNFILASYLVDHAKPSHEIFDLALRQVPGVLCNESVHIGDNIKLDYLAAKEAGWKSLLMMDKKLVSDDLKYVNPSDVIENINQIKEHIIYQ